MVHEYGMPDESADVDNDGFQTLEEYIAGTDPTNSASFFQIGIAADGIQIPSVSNRLYTVEGCSSLTGGTTSSSSGDSGDAVAPAWQVVTNLLTSIAPGATEVPGIGNTLTVPLDTNRFYRVKVSLP